MAFSAVGATSDILTFKETMNYPDKFHFAKEILKERKDLELNKVWKCASKNSIPSCEKN